MRMGVNIEAVGPRPGRQGHVQILCQGDGQPGGPRYAQDDGNAGTGRFLDQFVTYPRTEGHHPGLGQFAVQEQATDGLVQTIVASHIFTDDQKFSFVIEDGRGVGSGRLTP